LCGVKDSTTGSNNESQENPLGSGGGLLQEDEQA
jgi:hypothetical protein